MHMAQVIATFNEEKCLSEFDATFSTKVQKAMVEAVKEATREAAEVFGSKRVQRPQRKQTQAGLRRALLETKLREIAQQYSLDNTTDLVHEGKRSANLIIRHGVIALTQKYNNLDYAKYRDTLARMNAESLFSVHRIPEEADALFAVLNYTLDELDSSGSTVASIEAIFPAPQGRLPVARLDLLKRFSAIDSTTEEIANEVNIKTKTAAEARRAARRAKKQA